VLRRHVRCDHPGGYVGGRATRVSSVTTEGSVTIEDESRSSGG
jgi:hypothetical protein